MSRLSAGRKGTPLARSQRSARVAEPAPGARSCVASSSPFDAGLQAAVGWPSMLAADRTGQRKAPCQPSPIEWHVGRNEPCTCLSRVVPFFIITRGLPLWQLLTGYEPKQLSETGPMERATARGSCSRTRTRRGRSLRRVPSVGLSEAEGRRLGLRSEAEDAERSRRARRSRGRVRSMAREASIGELAREAPSEELARGAPSEELARDAPSELAPEGSSEELARGRGECGGRGSARP